jgi:putative hydrolase of the HAD superfamily
MPFRAIIVDFYDVLYAEKDPSGVRAFEQKQGLPAGGLQEAMVRSRYFHAARLGEISGETLWQDVAEQIGMAPDQWQVLVSIRESAFGLNDELVALLEQLHPHYKIALLSNATPHVRRLVTHRFHLDHLFDAMVISAEEGVKKPEPESYERTVRRLQVPAHETIFVDDDQSYVAAAQALGMWGIVFRTMDQATQDLQQLLVPSDRTRLFDL